MQTPLSHSGTQAFDSPIKLDGASLPSVGISQRLESALQGASKGQQRKILRAFINENPTLAIINPSEAIKILNLCYGCKLVRDANRLRETLRAIGTSSTMDSLQAFISKDSPSREAIQAVLNYMRSRRHLNSEHASLIRETAPGTIEIQYRNSCHAFLGYSPSGGRPVAPGFIEVRSGVLQPRDIRDLSLLAQAPRAFFTSVILPSSTKTPPLPTGKGWEVVGSYLIATDRSDWENRRIGKHEKSAPTEGILARIKSAITGFLKRFRSSNAQPA